ncbi:hypothetical protein BDR07DRAFT_1609092 [Suillus spraguei]|nr:hypothetical protein BDR07DRAFT_1609092 [Suillus spraguei]
MNVLPEVIRWDCDILQCKLIRSPLQAQHLTPTDGKIAQEVLNKGQADVVFVGRFFQKNPASVWAFASDLGVTIKIANQIVWGFGGRGVGHKKIDW